MKFLFDLFPVILFFAVFKIAGHYPADSQALASQLLGTGVLEAQAPILMATAVAILATFAQISWVWTRHRKVDTMLWVSLAVITVFGGATLLFQNETFIKWKPTVLYWLFAAILLGSSLFFRKNLMHKLLSEKIALTDAGWRTINLSWIGFFTAMGVINLVVAYRFSTDTWVNFKLFGGMGLTLVFVLIQGLMLARHIVEEK
ncbi:MAG TPA: septation protein A [Rhodocyclaceae bacterium]